MESNELLNHFKCGGLEGELGVCGSMMPSHRTCIFGFVVATIAGEADGERSQPIPKLLLHHRNDDRGVNAARKKRTNRDVGFQARAYRVLD